MADVSVTLRPPCLCPSEGHKHGVSIQSSLNLGDTLLQITRWWKTAETWFFARLFIHQSSIVSQTLDFFHWMVTIFILITWLVKTENYARIERFPRGKGLIINHLLTETAREAMRLFSWFLFSAPFWFARDSSRAISYLPPRLILYPRLKFAM